MVLASLATIALVVGATDARAGAQLKAMAKGLQVAFEVTPARLGRQLVRVSLPLPRRLVGEGQTLVASDERRTITAAVRALTWHGGAGQAARSVQRALVTFPYNFASLNPVRFIVRPTTASAETAPRLPVDVRVRSEVVTVAYRGGATLKARLVAPARTSRAQGKAELVESNAHFLWKRTRLPDPQWPRIIEVRADALGGVVLVAHLQRNLPGDGRAPDFGWEVETQPSDCYLREGVKKTRVAAEGATHSFADGKPCLFEFEGGRYRIYHPCAPFKRRGRVEVRLDEKGTLQYRYLRCTAEEKVPMQQASWQRAEIVIAPSSLAALTPTLEYPHGVKVDWRSYDALYGMGQPLDLKGERVLSAALRYHHDAIMHSAARGDDWGNVTAYADGSRTGAAFGMNRLNHCAAIFEEGWRSGDRRLLEVAVLWCENFHDQTIWWGPGETGGTRYNNMVAMGKTPPDNDQSYMWRSNSAVSFCTKGFDAFLLAYEQTGDPRMMEALEAQVGYAEKSVHADQGEARNIGIARDFLRLYEYTGEQRFLDQALRLFRELRTKLSAGDLFSQSGHPIVPNPPFIDDDQVGYRNPFAKPYIIGYALAGLPELARHAPEETKLRDVVQAVADFLADSQDPIGGWRYPHPRSSYVIMSQAMEHAWQLVQADRFLGAQEKHLDAIERVLRQRIHGWKQTGKVFGGLTGWEIATGKVKQRSELHNLYQRPEDRDFARDYVEGQPHVGSSAPEGIVHFPEVLAFYLEHRPASRLLTPPAGDEPLGKVLARVAGN